MNSIEQVLMIYRSREAAVPRLLRRCGRVMPMTAPLKVTMVRVVDRIIRIIYSPCMWVRSDCVHSGVTVS